MNYYRWTNFSGVMNFDNYKICGVNINKLGKMGIKSILLVSLVNKTIESKNAS